MSFSLPANAPLLLAFAELPDPRKQRNQLYPLIDIVAVTVMGIICGAENFSLMRKAALNLLKGDTSIKAGIETKRKVAGWNPDYLLKILGVK